MTSRDEASADPYLDRCHERVGGAPELMGPWQLELLLGLGLRSRSTMLDLGCGTLRGGLHFVRFLDPGCYVGVDPDPDLLALGDELVTRAGLRPRRPRLLTLAAHDVLDASYEWVLTQSVLNHLDEAGIVDTVERVVKALARGGCWVSTAHFDPAVDRVEPGARHRRRPSEFWLSRTNPRWFDRLLESHGLDLESIPGAAHPRALDVFVARRA